MMPLFGQVSKFKTQNQQIVSAIQTSLVIFLLSCCRYLDSSIDMYHVMDNLILAHQPALEWMALKRSVT